MYKPTLFDRHGPDAGNLIRGVAYGLMVFGLCVPLFSVLANKLEIRGLLSAILFIVVGSSVAAAVATFAGLAIGGAVGNTWKRFAVDGTSTPYKEQYSYQQSLVMRGQLDEALESFEAVIAEKPDEVDPRVKAAELYARERGNPQRAAELFRQVQRIATVSPGEDIYATNRLVDLLTGPLNEPGRALVELRRLCDRYPNTAAAVHARDAIAALKPQVLRE